MKKTIIFSAPYMMTSVERFRRVLEGHYGIEMIVPDVKQKLLEDDIIKYAGQFDGTICGDDEYSARVIEACSPRLKVVSKWGTGIDAIDKEACKKFGVMIGNTLNAFTIPVSETAIGYMLSFARSLPFMDRTMHEGKWDKPAITTLSRNDRWHYRLRQHRSGCGAAHPSLRYPHPGERYRPGQTGFPCRKPYRTGPAGTAAERI